MISPEKKRVEEILNSSAIKYVVPSYQRGFDWGKGELEELFDDIEDIMKNENRNLFLGSFIFDTSKNNGYEIVDGQQRLTTLTLIFIAVREHAKLLNESEIASEVQQYISVYSRIRKTNEQKITVSANIQEVFSLMSNIDWDGEFPENINGKSIKRQINKIKPIFLDVMERFKKFNADKLSDFTEKILDSYVIVLNVEGADDVFSIFERTNARGLDLNIGDLLKNYIFSHSVDKFEGIWLDVINNAEGSLQRMLKYFWVSKNGHVLQSALYKKLKTYGNKVGIESFVKDLYDFSRYYKTAQSVDFNNVYDWLEEKELSVLSKNEDYYKTITRVFQGLKLFRVTQAYPLIYSIFKSFEELGQSNTKQLLQILKSIEKYHFINNVVSGRTANEIEKTYAEQAKIFYNNPEGKTFVELVENFLSILQDKKALKDEFTSNFIESITYNQKNIQLLNYVFDRINNTGAKGAQYVDIYSPEKDLQKRNYNIEHFLAQSKKDKYKSDEIETFDQIGNLLVISRHTNSTLQDKDPKEKIKLIQSDLKHFGNLRYISNFLENYKDDFDEWNLDSIEKRSRNLADKAYQIVWNY